MITANRSIVHYNHLLFLRGDVFLKIIGLFLPSAPAAVSLFWKAVSTMDVVATLAKLTQEEQPEQL